MENLLDNPDDFNGHDEMNNRMDEFLLTSEVKEQVLKATERIRENQKIQLYKHRKQIAKKIMNG